jgi:hypothetical protein
MSMHHRPHPRLPGPSGGRQLSTRSEHGKGASPPKPYRTEPPSCTLRLCDAASERNRLSGLHATRPQNAFLSWPPVECQLRQVSCAGCASNKCQLLPLLPTYAAVECETHHDRGRRQSRLPEWRVLVIMALASSVRTWLGSTRPDETNSTGGCLAREAPLAPGVAQVTALSRPRAGCQ